MEKYYWYWLSNISGIGLARQKRLLEYFESPYNIYNAAENELKMIEGLSSKEIESIILYQKKDELYESYNEMQNKDIKMVTYRDTDYPDKLRNIYDAPICLYYKGNLPDNNKPSVAIVGSRACSEYGKNIARNLSKKLALHGINIISGMAAGIDAYSHRGALDSMINQCTYAVLGCSVDICYPACNKKLYQDIIENGGILSEYPIDVKPAPYQFPMRNRIISGLSDIVVVVEARKKSGSLITVDQAIEQNREVMAVPGRITDYTSEGCNRLIQMGAGVVLDENDIIEELESIYSRKFKILTKETKKIFQLAPDEKIVYSVLDLTPKSVDCIMKETCLTYEGTLKAVVNLTLKGAARETALNHYIKV